MEEITTYRELREYFLSRYYGYCRTKLNHKSRWSEGESEVGYAYSEFDNSFDTPVEKLMLEVLSLILDAGRAKENIQEYHRSAIRKIFDENELSDMLKKIPAEDASELKSDLRILGFIS